MSECEGKKKKPSDALKLAFWQFTEELGILLYTHNNKQQQLQTFIVKKADFLQ
jgi:hypothetical protein